MGTIVNLFNVFRFSSSFREVFSAEAVSENFCSTFRKHVAEALPVYNGRSCFTCAAFAILEVQDPPVPVPPAAPNTMPPAPKADPNNTQAAVGGAQTCRVFFLILGSKELGFSSLIFPSVFAPGYFSRSRVFICCSLVFMFRRIIFVY